jgi:hypothetical protein
MEIPAPYKFMDTSLSFEERVADLISRLTLEEKISQMVHTSCAIERLGIPEYNWWNECLHGVARNGTATVFPQAIGLASMWDTDMMYRAATVISDEARAKHHESLRQGDHGALTAPGRRTSQIEVRAEQGLAGYDKNTHRRQGFFQFRTPSL